MWKSVLCGASVTERLRVRPQTARARISNPVSGGPNNQLWRLSLAQSGSILTVVNATTLRQWWDRKRTMAGCGQVHRYLYMYLPVLKYIFPSTCLYFVLELKKCTCTCTCTHVHYKVLGTWRQVHCKYIRFVPKKIYYNLLFQLFSAIILII